MKDNSQKGSILNFMAFIALVIFALLEVLSAIEDVIKLGTVIMNVLISIKNVCILLVVGVLAYKFVENKGKGLKITYWIAMGIFFAATILTWVLSK